MEGPHERSIVPIIDSLDCAVGDLHECVVIQGLVSIDPALSILNQSIIVIPLIHSEWSLLGNLRIECAIAGGCTLWAFVIWSWAVYGDALSLTHHGLIVEAKEPVGAVVNGESPLTHPDLSTQVHESSGEVVLSFIFRAVVVGIEHGWVFVLPEGHVTVVVHGDHIPISWWEKIQPVFICWSEAVVENEIACWAISVSQLAGLSVEVHEEVDVVGLQWLVYWFVAEHGGVGTELLQESLGLTDTPLNIGIVE